MTNIKKAKTKDGNGFIMEDLFNAIEELNTSKISSIVRENPSVLFTEKDGELPLPYACALGNLTSVTELFEHFDHDNEAFKDQIEKAYLNAMTINHPQLLKFLNQKLFGWDELQDKPTPTPKPF